MKTLGTKKFLKSIWAIEDNNKELGTFKTKTHMYVWMKSLNEIIISANIRYIGDFDTYLDMWIYRETLSIDTELNHDLNQNEVFEIIKEHYKNNYKECYEKIYRH